jgi:hypothetical protein
MLPFLLNKNVGNPMAGPTFKVGNGTIDVDGPVQGGFITTYGSATGTLSTGAVNAPVIPTVNNGGVIDIDAPVQGGSILTGGTLGNLTIGGSLSGQVVTIGNMLGTVAVNGAVQGGVIATSGSIIGNVTIGGGLTGDLLAAGNIAGNVSVHGGLLSGRIAALGSILGTLTTGDIDSHSAVVSGGSISNLNAGNVNGIVAAVGSISVGKIGNTSQALLYKQNDTADQAVIDAIFSQGLLPSLSPTDLFDHGSLLDLEDLAGILANLNSLTVQNGKLVIA